MEGRQRHANVRAAIKSVLEEQERQRMFLPEGCTDPIKLRSVYLQHTHWARELAQAAGQSDADAVQCKFDDTKRRPREFFLKSNFSKDGAIDTGSLPLFMKTVLTISNSNNKLDLDANTTTHICYRKKAIASGMQPLKRTDTMMMVKKTRETPILPVDDLPEEKKCEADDLIPTPVPEDSRKDLAKKAAGWGISEDSENNDQLKILTGMGLASPQQIMG
jgi:hypothetical protein